MKIIKVNNGIPKIKKKLTMVFVVAGNYYAVIFCNLLFFLYGIASLNCFLNCFISFRQIG